MNAIAEIKERLLKYPQAKYEHTGNQITVLPQDERGFAVSLVDNAPHYTVAFNSWHDEYEDVEQALNVFAFGLSDDCRLKVTCRGRFAYVWTVEEKGGSGEWFSCEWIGLNEVGLLVPPLFWLRKHHVYLQNTLLKSDKQGHINNK